MLVDPLPAGNLIPDRAAWMHTLANTEIAQKHWLDESSVANLISCSAKTGEPSPYVGHTLGTALRLADGVGEDGCGNSTFDEDGVASYVVSANNTKLLLEFTSWYVSNNIVHFRFIIYGGPSATGPWVEVWRLLDHDPWHSTLGTWTFLSDSPVQRKVIGSGHAFYKIEFQGKYTSTDSSGQKWTGTYFRVTDAENADNYSDITVGNTTANNSGNAARSNISVAHDNNGDMLLVGVVCFGVTTTVPAYSNVAYGGVPLTKIDNATILNSYISNRHLLCEWYYLNGVTLPTGNNNLTASLANSNRDALIIYSLSGANQTGEAIGRIYTAKNSLSTIRMTGYINTTHPKSHVFAQAVCNSGDVEPFAPILPWQEGYDIATGTGGGNLSATSWHRSVAQPDTISHDTASTADANFSESIVEIVAFSTSPPQTNTAIKSTLIVGNGI